MDLNMNRFRLKRGPIENIMQTFKMLILKSSQYPYVIRATLGDAKGAAIILSILGILPKSGSIGVDCALLCID